MSLKNLSKVRKEKGLTQEALARKADISYHTLLKIERGDIKNPKIQTVMKLAGALNVDINKIIVLILLVLFPSVASGASDFATGKSDPTAKTRAMNNLLIQRSRVKAQAIAQTQTLNSQFTYTYDNVGNRISATSPQGTQTYTYNPLYELEGVTGAQTHSYTYDPVGNRTQADGTVYIPNPLNQYDSVGGTPFTYDPNGNLTSDGTYTYTYDYENRLKTVTGPGLNVTYTYDPHGRRIKKEVNGVITYYLYDGDQIIEERDNTFQLKATYTYGTDIDEVLTMNRNNQTFYYFYDGLGSVTDLTTGQGEVVESYTYDPYGNPNQPSAVGNPYFFTGRQLDPETGLYHYRARHYHPAIGRFMQRDPIGELPDENVYRYVGNNPLTLVDPIGLQGVLPTTVIPGTGLPGPISLPKPVPGTEVGNKELGGKPTGLGVPQGSGANMAEAAANAEEKAKGQQGEGEKKGNKGGQKPKPPVDDAKFKKKDGKWGWWDKLGRRWKWDSRKGEWDVEPNPRDKNPIWRDPTGKSHRPKHGHWNINPEGYITHGG